MREKVVVGIDIGGTKTLIGIVDHTGKIISKHQFPTDDTLDPVTHFKKCITVVNMCLEETGIDEDSLGGIGVNVPGLANSEKGILLHAPYLGWRNVNVRDILSEQWPTLPIKVANDVNACALGELVFGAGTQLNHFLWVTISTGIGGGVIVDRQIYQGEAGISGEIGHTIVEWADGNRCGCGNRGCLEAHASGTAIAAMAEKRMQTKADVQLLEYFRENNLDVSAKNVAAAAYAGVNAAKDIYRTAGMFIGRALSYSVNILNPGAIFVGGGVSLSFELMETSIRKVFQAAVIDEKNKQLPILKTALGYEAGLIGAASLIYSCEKVG